jgi:hypothetical protein
MRIVFLSPDFRPRLQHSGLGHWAIRPAEVRELIDRISQPARLPETRAKRRSAPQRPKCWLPSESRAGVPIRSPVQTETRVVDLEDLVEVVVVERRSVPAKAAR